MKVAKPRGPHKTASHCGSILHPRPGCILLATPDKVQQQYKMDSKEHPSPEQDSKLVTNKKFSQYSCFIGIIFVVLASTAISGYIWGRCLRWGSPSSWCRISITTPVSTLVSTKVEKSSQNTSPATNIQRCFIIQNNKYISADLVCFGL